jgi:hypothetical protein
MSKRDYLKHLSFTTAAAIVTANKTKAMSNEPTIAEMNKAIALFMGYKKREKLYPTDRQILEGEGLPNWYEDSLEYHSSWDWLMPVIEKISKIPLLHWDNRVCTDPQDVCYPRTFGMPTEDGTQVMVRLNGFSLHTAPTLIEAAHMAVYEVAEYHNKQQSNENK